MINTDLLKALAAQAGMPVTQAQADVLDRYAELLVAANEKVNLTAVTAPDEIVTKHFLDSILPLGVLDAPLNATVIDVGTGAGFPGIPMKIMRPDIRLILLDSLLKRVTILTEFCAELGLQDVRCIHARAEEAGRSELRESCDLAVSRAVARMNVLTEYCLPFLKVGGQFAALKGPAAAEEAAEARRAVSILGGKMLDPVAVNIPGTDMTHCLLIAAKIAHTPEKYPRPSAKIAKLPL